MAAGDPSAGTALPTLMSPLRPAPTVAGHAPVQGTIRAAGGPFLVDGRGRTVLLHGVNAVYKRPPFVLYPAPGKPWNFTSADASLMARLGFNVVRLGLIWKGLEPGTAPANDPSICGPGPLHDPGQFNQAVLNRYLAKVAQTVALLAKYHIYTLLDMHQDVYNELFDGEGAPNWAVCTGGHPSIDPPGRWSTNYATAAAGAAYGHFWRNDVAGDLQGEYDRVWADVAAYFSKDPWVVGFDPFNEPFSTSLVKRGDEEFDHMLECFYTGRTFVGNPAHGAPAAACPPDDPLFGLVPRLETAAPSKLVFYEPDIFARHGSPNFVGPMNFPNLVFNVHVYCSLRSGKTGNPTDVAGCAAQEHRALITRSEDRSDLSSSAQPGGPPWFVSEFGASSSTALVRQLTGEMDRSLVGWAYWSWKYYGDPTGSSSEALLIPDGHLRNTVRSLSRTYPEAIAGTPEALSFDATNGAFDLTYRPNHAVRAPTVIFVPTGVHYPHGYCTRVTGAAVISKPDSELLQLENSPGAPMVQVTVTAGSCS